MKILWWFISTLLEIAASIFGLIAIVALTLFFAFGMMLSQCSRTPGNFVIWDNELFAFVWDCRAQEKIIYILDPMNAPEDMKEDYYDEQQ